MISLTLRPLLCLLLCLAGLSAAEPNRTGGNANLVVWNRHLMEFRAPIGFASVQERADRAAERIAQLPDEALTLPITAKPAVLGELKGVMITAGPHFLFAIAEGDMDATGGETMDMVAPPAAAVLVPKGAWAPAPAQPMPV